MVSQLLAARVGFERYGRKFAGSYGWAHAALSAKDKRYLTQQPVTFGAIEENVGLAHMRPHYRMASHGVHANPKSITFTPDLPEAEHGLALLTGASPAGLADPGHGTLISLTQVTATVLASKGGEATGLVIGTMLQLTDRLVTPTWKRIRLLSSNAPPSSRAAVLRVLAGR